MPVGSVSRAPSPKSRRRSWQPLPTTSPSARSDLILRGQALLSAYGQEAGLSTVRRAVRAFLEQPSDARELHWMWFGGRAAQDVWDAEGLRTLAERQVELARAGGVLTMLPMALAY